MATANYWHSQWLPTLGFRPGRSTHQLERGQTIRTMQELLGHSNVRSRMFDTDVLNRAPLGAASPDDLL
jgi:site-specific recombinase XerD